MKKRVFTYSIIAALALTLMVPVIALSQMGPRRQGLAWAPQPSGAQDFARGRGRGDGAGARRGRGFGREFGRRGGRGDSFSGACFGDNARSSLAARALACADALGLTADQEQHVRETQRAYQDASIGRRAAMQVAQLDMRELQRAVRREQIRRDADLEIAEMDLEEMMDDDGASLDAIEQKMREVANLGVDARMGGLRLERNVMTILTLEQREQLEELMPERVLYESVLRQRRR